MTWLFRMIPDSDWIELWLLNPGWLMICSATVWGVYSAISGALSQPMKFVQKCIIWSNKQSVWNWIKRTQLNCVWICVGPFILIYTQIFFFMHTHMDLSENPIPHSMHPLHALLNHQVPHWSFVWRYTTFSDAPHEIGSSISHNIPEIVSCTCHNYISFILIMSWQMCFMANFNV